MRKPKFIFALIFAAALATACGGAANQDRAGRGNSANANSATNAAAQTPQTPLEIELARLQRANFRQIIAFSRKDGGKITDEDKEYFREYAPSMQINQRLVTDDEQYFVAGTNFVFTPEQLDALGKRFAIEDFTEKYGRKLETPTPKKEN